MALDTIGSIATHIVENISVSAGISGNMVEIVDMARQHVANYVSVEIGSNSIEALYQPAIVDFAKADVIDLINAGTGGDSVTLADLSISSNSTTLTSEQYRTLGEMKLRALGMKIRFARSLS